MPDCFAGTGVDASEGDAGYLNGHLTSNLEVAENTVRRLGGLPVRAFE
jgi:hypothetical protein